jgi:hypothetical protein
MVGRAVIAGFLVLEITVVGLIFEHLTEFIKLLVYQTIF